MSQEGRAQRFFQVFEPRYLDLVRDCGRNGSTFGVCLILEGREVGEPATPAAFGCEAVIEDFDTGTDGLLALRLRGRRRFRVLRTRVRDNGLVVGEVEWREPDSDDELRPEHALLATVLQKILEQIDMQGAALSQHELDNAAWVSWRLAELLPNPDHWDTLALSTGAHTEAQLIDLLDQLSHAAWALSDAIASRTFTLSAPHAQSLMV